MGRVPLLIATSGSRRLSAISMTLGCTKIHSLTVSTQMPQGKLVNGTFINKELRIEMEPGRDLTSL